MPFNFILEQSRLLRNSDGAVMLGLRVPDDFLFPGYPTEQTGDWVKMALNKPKKWQGEWSRSTSLIPLQISAPILQPATGRLSVEC